MILSATTNPSASSSSEEEAEAGALTTMPPTPAQRSASDTHRPLSAASRAE
jgi:hypothetical protein